ncbi:MAG: cbb3-type cytochrome c oxidase subunit 3 [Gammaproteobacteria bacterium]|nr:cbb3-type cytochrome c oxidase subunit 3 [Gammaproteobacteria bacterium]MYI89421.1 cbb3-type cytochrome c oxidase subunit 3 [Gammaproteobacteria bacterium]
MVWVHIIWTMLLLTTFIVIIVWAWSGKQKSRFQDAAQIPLEDDLEKPRRTVD